MVTHTYQTDLLKTVIHAVTLQLYEFAFSLSLLCVYPTHLMIQKDHQFWQLNSTSINRVIKYTCTLEKLTSYEECIAYTHPCDSMYLL